MSTDCPPLCCTCHDNRPAATGDTAIRHGPSFSLSSLSDNNVLVISRSCSRQSPGPATPSRSRSTRLHQMLTTPSALTSSIAIVVYLLIPYIISWLSLQCAFASCHLQALAPSGGETWARLRSAIQTMRLTTTTRQTRCTRLHQCLIFLRPLLKYLYPSRTSSSEAVRSTPPQNTGLTPSFI